MSLVNDCEHRMNRDKVISKSVFSLHEVTMNTKNHSYYFATASLLFLIWLMPLHSSHAQTTEGETFSLELKNADIISLIETVSFRTKKNFIVDPRVKASVNVVSTGPIDADELYDIFLSVLDVHGYAAVNAGNLVKIVPTTVGVTSALPVFSDDTNEANDELVTRVIQLKNMPAQQLIESLRPLLSESGSMSAESVANTIVVTDRAANITKIVGLISRVVGSPD
jgi:general secretion pathway protein D